jgi:type IV pilus assembly protein PilO
MNLSEINWDINEAGVWPLPIKIIAILIVCIAAAAAGYYYDTVDQMDQLAALEKIEIDLKSNFEIKQKKAVNLQDYKDQLQQIESLLQEMIRQMPTKAEVASLLVDISQTGLASGLEFRLFKPSQPIKRDFYYELPIDIQVIGKYEELGLFVSGLSSLPRIVTVHNVKISPMAKSDTMVMNTTVKTYNEGSENDSGAPAAGKKAGPAKRIKK